MLHIIMEDVFKNIVIAWGEGIDYIFKGIFSVWSSDYNGFIQIIMTQIGQNHFTNLPPKEAWTLLLMLVNIVDHFRVHR